MARRSNVIYANLRAEMARREIGILDISKKLGMNRDTLSRKLSGKSPLYLSEAVEIQQRLFRDVDIKELFRRNNFVEQ